MISVITCHIAGREKFLEEAYQSLLQQDTEWEWLIQSDCNTPDINDDRVKPVQETLPLGISEKRNRALLRSSGDIISNLDDDDLLPPGSLEIRAQGLKQAPYSFGIHAYIDGPTRHIPFEEGIVLGEDIITEWRDRKQNNIQSVSPTPAGVMWRRDFLWKLGGRPALPRSADTALLMQAASREPGFFIPEITYLVREHPNRSSQDYQSENWQWIEEWLQKNN